MSPGRAVALLPGGLLGFWVIGLWVLSSLPGGDVSLPTFPYSDKAAHFVYFAGGGFLLAWSLRVYCRWRWRVVVMVAVLGMAVIGAGDEWHQLFTPGRSGADLGDWGADFLGGLAGALGFRFIHGTIITRKTSG